MTFELTSQEARLLAEKKGVVFTTPGLMSLGRHHGFAHREDVRSPWRFSREGLEAYLDQRQQSAPQDWVTVAEAARLSGLTVNLLRGRIRRDKWPTKYYGAGRGVMHVERDRAVGEGSRSGDEAETEKKPG
jgi:hypothetical protein